MRKNEKENVRVWFEFRRLDGIVCSEYFIILISIVELLFDL